MQSQMQTQGLELLPEAEVGPSAACINTKESCVDPSRQDPETGDIYKYGLYVVDNPPRLVALGRVYEGSMIVQNVSLGNDQVKVDVEEIRVADARVLVPT